MDLFADSIMIRPNPPDVREDLGGSLSLIIAHEDSEVIEGIEKESLYQIPRLNEVNNSAAICVFRSCSLRISTYVIMLDNGSGNPSVYYT